MSVCLKSDFLVLGSGIAGLLAAHKLSSLGQVNLVTKKEAVDSNTNYAQGGIAAVMGELDSFESHVRDTLKSGAGLCHEEVARSAVQEGPERIRELMALGVQFSQKETRLDLGLEGGHSQRRILHAGDFTGKEIEKILIQHCRANPRIAIFENAVAVDLITQQRPEKCLPRLNRCWGAYVLDNRAGAVLTFLAKTVILATGGAGKVYLYTSNPDIATGDGIAMAFRAGAHIANMEFFQFHPTCLYYPPAAGAKRESAEFPGKTFLLSEALRGEGGVLRLKDGARFMEKYSAEKDLAPRDIVARAIDKELKRTGDDCVFLDMTGLSAEFLRQRFPNLHQKCLSIGIAMESDWIPVVPAAHFCCGGVSVGRHGETELDGLYAIGEASHTGLHGANRLASNSLLEGCVYAQRVFNHIKSNWPSLQTQTIPSFPAWASGKAIPSDEEVVLSQNWDEIRRLMWNYVGIVRSNRRLERAKARMEILDKEIQQYYWDFFLSRDLIELRNIATIAQLIIRCASLRPESRGLHYNIDAPAANDLYKRDTLVNRYGEVLLTPLTKP
ncbi:MAG: L-aspartate oxidase [Elusimicrobia bacterium]|nr:L-aspartate oxidase [Elusimicrobiota bacterium]